MPEPNASVAREYDVDLGERPRLHVSEWGEAVGPPVVFLHGGAHDGAHWALVCQRLPAAWRCIAPDQRGHGASDRAPDGDYSCAAQVGDLVALLDALDVARCALVGHSMGGLNALHLAGTRPERVAALVLADVSSETRSAGLAAIERTRSRLPSRPDAAALPFDVRLLDFVPTYGGNRTERRSLLRASRAPLLVLRGAKSRILSAEIAAESARLGNGETAEIPNAGHDVAGHNPHAVAAELVRFLGPLLNGPKRPSTD